MDKRQGTRIKHQMPRLVRDRDVVVLRGKCTNCNKSGRHSLIITGFEENYLQPELGFVVFKCMKCDTSYKMTLHHAMKNNEEN